MNGSPIFRRLFPRHSRRLPARALPRLEALEDRSLPSTLFPGPATTRAPAASGDANVGVTIVSSDSTPQYGQSFDLTITLTNQGPDAATNVQVGDVLDPGLTFVSDTPSASTTFDTASMTWTVPSVPADTTSPPTLTLHVRRDSLSALTAKATINSLDQTDTATGDNTSTVSFVAIPSVDLRLTQQVDNASPNVGDTVTFTLTLTNTTSLTTATGITVSDRLPAQLSYDAADSQASSGTTYDPASGVWSVGSLGGTRSATLTIKAKVLGQTPQTNTAVISGADQPDPVLTNNSASDTVTPQSADLQLLSLTVDNATPTRNGQVTFTLVVKNNGPDDATGVEITEKLPTGLTFLSSNPSSGTYTGTTGVWSIAKLAGQAAAVLQVTAAVNADGPQTVTASITKADQFDPIPNNTIAPVTVTPLSVRLGLGQTLSTAQAFVGDNVVFTLTVTNQNTTGDATNVKVTDNLPGSLDFVTAGTPSLGTFDSDHLVWSIDRLAPGQSATLQITAQANTFGTIANQIQVTSDQVAVTGDTTPPNLQVFRNAGQLSYRMALSTPVPDSVTTQGGGSGGSGSGGTGSQAASNVATAAMFGTNPTGATGSNPLAGSTSALASSVVPDLAGPAGGTSTGTGSGSTQASRQKGTSSLDQFFANGGVPDTGLGN